MKDLVEISSLRLLLRLHEHDAWLRSSGKKGVQADLRNIDLTGHGISYVSLWQVKLYGPELLNLTAFSNITVPRRLLPFLSCHPNFALWFPTLTIVDDEV